MKQKTITLHCGLELIVFPFLFAVFVKVCQKMGIKKFDNKEIKLSCVFKKKFWKSKYQKNILPLK